MNMRILKKISGKTVFGDMRKLLSADVSDGDVIPVFRFTANVTGTKNGETDNGPWMSLNGTCYATNLQTGEVFTAPALFIPIEAAVYVAGSLSKDIVSVKCEGVVSITVNSNSVRGYDNTVSLEPQESYVPDPALVAMMEKAGTPLLTADSNPAVADIAEAKKKGAK